MQAIAENRGSTVKFRRNSHYGDSPIAYPSKYYVVFSWAVKKKYDAERLFLRALKGAHFLFQEVFMEYILLIIGFVLLVKGADFFVDGASSIAGKLKVPSLIIGLTIVSIGTSLPEAAVSITSSLQGSYDLSIANVIGSNIFNLLMVVGLILHIVLNKKIAD